MATATAVAGYTLSNGGTPARVGAGIAAVGVAALLVAVVFRFGVAVPWAVLLVGAGYLVEREQHGVADGWAAIVGAALLLAAELAFWSVDHDARIREDRALVARQAAILGALVAVAALIGFVLVGAAAISASASLLLTAVGVAAAVASVTVVLRLLR